MNKLFLIFNMLLFLVSCSSDDTNKKENAIIGTWNLIIFENGISPTENFSIGDIIWNFQENSNLSINSSRANIPIRSKGSYSYSLNGNKIFIDAIDYDYSFLNNQLIIFDNPSSDGFKATFTKIE